jgi:ATP-dependent exoDNAse (exonuclease V) beta subunit|tara:strand:+ start:870 stop:1730 length:861 start_codon:yes stop_codon:yes gene_type:complete
MFLEEKNKHQRDNLISFEEKGHQYTVDEDLTYTSTTTWIKTFFEEFNSDKIIDKMTNSKNWENSKYYGKTKEQIKNEWKEQGNIASMLGTKLHQDIENYYNEIKVDNDSVEYQYFLNFRNEYPQLKPYRTEWCIWDKELKICGSIDMVFLDEEGNLLIFDWKRCKEIKTTDNWGKKSNHQHLKHITDTNFWHYALQLNIYKAILEKNYDSKISGLYIVCLHPNNTNYNKFEIPNLQKEVKLLFEERLEELNSIEVEEIEKNGKIYLVDINNNIYSEEGEVIGTWPI